MLLEAVQGAGPTRGACAVRVGYPYGVALVRVTLTRAGRQFGLRFGQRQSHARSSACVCEFDSDVRAYARWRVRFGTFPL